MFRRIDLGPARLLLVVQMALLVLAFGFTLLAIVEGPWTVIAGAACIFSACVLLWRAWAESRK